jgi:hypothetical protein
MCAREATVLQVTSGPNRTLVAFAAYGDFEPKAAPEPITLTTPKQTFVLGSTVGAILVPFDRVRWTLRQVISSPGMIPNCA